MIKLKKKKQITEKETKFIKLQDLDDYLTVDESEKKLDQKYLQDQFFQILYQLMKENSKLNSYQRYIKEINKLTTEEISFEIMENIYHYYHGDTQLINEILQLSKEKVLKEIQLYIEDLDDTEHLNSKSTQKCQICEKKISKKSRYSLKCSHLYCSNCWERYIHVEINNGNCNNIQCMGYKCTRRVTNNFLLKLITPEILYLLKLRKLKSFYRYNKDYTLCPLSTCEKIVSRKNIIFGTDACCECGHIFCFDCGNISHSPATCKEVENWELRKSLYSNTSNWLIKNTKRCPECSKVIEKNGGCNHMTCRKNLQGCGYEFCWVCLKKWEGHSSYNTCRKFTEFEYETKMKKHIKELKEYMVGPISQFELYDPDLTKAKTQLNELLQKQSLESNVTKQKKIVYKLSALTIKPLIVLNSSEMLKVSMENYIFGLAFLKWVVITQYENKPNENFLTFINKKTQAIQIIVEQLKKQLDEKSKNIKKIWETSIKLKSQLSQYYIEKDFII
ncbi:e3 ubiquitin-protein ligase ari5-related [Anaeramoeba flamelloides]|uniref:RBR-type E3 ubiquitin transferase n=1 Tax=Anaeramoeba flamelloides TaxID=1746091 RepID=A0ABQ8X0P2_9EUKA|nr:e3 ubiquitin-protein ligase ari5-related [Anaeramoeba flamelloides]